MNMDIFTQKDIFPEHVFLNFINVWNIKKVLTVPRKPEFPCEPNQCHYNVGLNQILKGGESVIGFSVSNIGQNVVLEPHSVWKTPEDNLDYKDEYIDVTPNIYGEETDIKFLPLKFYDSSKEFYDVYHSFRFFYQGTKHKCEMRIGNEKPTIHDVEFLKGKDFSSLVFHRNYSIEESENWNEYCDDLGVSLKNVVRYMNKHNMLNDDFIEKLNLKIKDTLF